VRVFFLESFIMVRQIWEQYLSSAPEQWREYVVMCPCGHQLRVRLCDYIDAAVSPDLKEDLLQNRLNRIRCDECGRDAPVEKKFIYCDVQQLFIAQCYPVNDLSHWPHYEQQLTDTLRKVGNAENEGQMCRLVFGQEALREKVRIRNAGLDDAAVEILKAAYYSQSDFQTYHLQAVWFSGIDSEKKALNMTVADRFTSKAELTYQYPVADYAEPMKSVLNDVENPLRIVTRGVFISLDKLLTRTDFGIRWPVTVQQ